VQKRAHLTASDLAILISIWPRGSRHLGPVGDVYSAGGRGGLWTLVARRADGSYVMIEEGGRRSVAGTSLAELGLPDQPIGPVAIRVAARERAGPWEPPSGSGLMPSTALAAATPAAAPGRPG
jgi:hypothetical protein